MGGSSRTGRRRPRTLTPDESRLWEKVAATTDVRADRPAVPRGEAPAEDRMPAIAMPAPAPRPAPAGRTIRPAPPDSGPRAAVSFADPEVGPVGRPEPGLDRRTATRLRKGGREPDARIDLHGMSVERAHRACLLFLSDALARGCRVVLVITGKGRADERDFMSRGRGVLRESLPGWLRASPLGASIVGIYQAHQKHGGAGAYYVYLKRRR